MPTAPLFAVAVVGDDTVITNTAFFPDISLNDFKAAVRVTDKNDEPVLLSLQAGMWDVNSELDAWKDTQVLAGYATLADVPETDLVLDSAYKLAVYHLAKAKLLDKYRDEDTTNTGHNRADDLDANADYHYAESRRWQRRMQGLSPVTAMII